MDNTLDLTPTQQLEQTLPPTLQGLSPTIKHHEPGKVSLHIPFAPQLIAANGQICCATYTALACFAMQIASQLPSEALSIQTINTRLEQRIAQHDILIQAQVLRRGRTLIFGDIKAYNPSKQLMAHSTCTYAL